MDFAHLFLSDSELLAHPRLKEWIEHHDRILGRLFIVAVAPLPIAIGMVGLGFSFQRSQEPVGWLGMLVVLMMLLAAIAIAVYGCMLLRRIQRTQHLEAFQSLCLETLALIEVSPSARKYRNEVLDSGRRLIHLDYERIHFIAMTEERGAQTQRAEAIDLLHIRG
jgi:hypothetical protein